jgi:hypothetical protein
MLVVQLWLRYFLLGLGLDLDLDKVMLVGFSLLFGLPLHALGGRVDVAKGKPASSPAGS